MNIGLLASGKLGLQCTHSLIKSDIIPHFIFTDKASVDLNMLAEAMGIPFLSGNPRNGKGIRFIETIGGEIDLIISINYLFLLDRDIINFPKYGCVNFHGSLLPKYRGRTPHVWAIINNEIETGISAHYIDDGCDTGPIILQRRIPIPSYATGGDMLLIFGKLYPELIKETISLFSSGGVKGLEQDENNATYFGKRTKDDGRIDWNWQKERINNWIRAQADPYPGAFTFCGDSEIVIDRIEYSNQGFSGSDPNGLVLKGGVNAEIKCPNGAVKILRNRNASPLQAGKILSS